MMYSVHWNQLSLDMYHILEADTHTETKFGSQCKPNYHTPLKRSENRVSCAL